MSGSAAHTPRPILSTRLKCTLIITNMIGVSMLIIGRQIFILLSSLAGAALIVNRANFSMHIEVALLASFALLEIAIQAIWLTLEDSSW